MRDGYFCLYYYSTYLALLSSLTLMHLFSYNPKISNDGSVRSKILPGTGAITSNTMQGSAEYSDYSLSIFISYSTQYMRKFEFAPHILVSTPTELLFSTSKQELRDRILLKAQSKLV